MNKSELTAHLKQGADSIDKILEAAQLQLDLQDYSPEQVQLVEAIAHLVSTKHAKTFKEAGEIYRKPQRESQLSEVAARHQIAVERIPEILAALKYKAETLTDAQLEQFGEVCAKLQSGVELAAALPAKATRGKKAAPAMPEFVPGVEGADVGGGAMLTLRESALASSKALVSLEVSEEDQATLRDIAEALAPEAVPNLANEMVQAADVVSGDLKQVAKQIFLEAALKQLRTQDNDPQRAVEMFRKLKRGEAI